MSGHVVDDNVKNLYSNKYLINKEEMLMNTIPYFSLIVITCSIIVFYLLNLVAKKIVYSNKGFENKSNLWRLKNTSVSWLHSITCSTLVVRSILKTPELLEDMINVSTTDAYVAICVTFGYFLYDSYDIIIVNGKLNTHSYEILTHHAIIIGVFSIPIYTNLFVGYTIAALLLELNTIFLHLRYIFVFNDVEKSSVKYKLVSMLNMITFVIFRILTLCWMIRWIVLNRKLIETVWFTIGSCGLGAMLIINILLLQRLIQADFQKSKKTKVESCSIEKEGKKID